MGAKQMKCLSSSSPARSPKEEYLSTPWKESGKSGKTERNHTVQPQSLKDDAAARSSAGEPSPGPEPAGMVDGASWEEQLSTQQEQLEKEMQETRKMVSRLQALLLHGSLPEDEQTASLFGEATGSAEQQLILIRSRLDQSTEESLDLKRELLKFKQEARNLQAVKDALQQRMSAQEDTVLKLKQELLRSTMDKEELTGQNVDLQRKLNDRDRLLSECKKELAHKDRQLQQQQVKVDESLRRLHECHVVSGCENNGYTHTLEMSSSSFSHGLGDELHLVRDALRSLRNSFSGHDPQHHTLDTLEQGMASLIDRLHANDSKKRQDRKKSHLVSPQRPTKSPGRRANHTERESWPPSSKMAHSHSSPVLTSSVLTKALYFTDRSLTPFLVNIPKRLGEITLQDFKVAVDRHGNFRYHFKSLDPEFGTVKEEVFQNDALVPGWEGKIVAWVEEDHGEGSEVGLEPWAVSVRPTVVCRRWWRMRWSTVSNAADTSRRMRSEDVDVTDAEGADGIAPRVTLQTACSPEHQPRTSQRCWIHIRSSGTQNQQEWVIPDLIPAGYASLDKGCTGLPVQHQLDQNLKNLSNLCSPPWLDQNLKNLMNLRSPPSLYGGIPDVSTSNMKDKWGIGPYSGKGWFTQRQQLLIIYERHTEATSDNIFNRTTIY